MTLDKIADSLLLALANASPGEAHDLVYRYLEEVDRLGTGNPEIPCRPAQEESE